MCRLDTSFAVHFFPFDINIIFRLISQTDITGLTKVYNLTCVTVY